MNRWAAERKSPRPPWALRGSVTRLWPAPGQRYGIDAMWEPGWPLARGCQPYDRSELSRHLGGPRQHNGRPRDCGRAAGKPRVFRWAGASGVIADRGTSCWPIMSGTVADPTPSRRLGRYHDASHKSYSVTNQ